MLDSTTVKEKLSTEDIIKLCCFLQEDDTLFYDAQGHPIFNSCLDHETGDSWKLYYYPETKLFFCYTSGGDGYDIFELVSRFKKISFKESFDYVVHFFGIKERGFEGGAPETLTDDWDIFQRVQDYSTQDITNAKIAPINENLLEYFYPLAAPLEWQKEGITPEVMRYYGIRIDSALWKIIIPHRDGNGKLIGIRGRSYNQIEIDAGKKYMPVYIQGDIYRHSLGQNLYGLFENKKTIKKIKKAFVVEAEKSVMQLASMYGIDNCWAVATCGSSFSKEQMLMLLDLGVEEVALGYDHEFEGGKGSPDTTEYEEKLLKIMTPLLPYVNVSIVMDYDHLTPLKASPTDCGKEIFEKLYHNRVRLHTTSDKRIKMANNDGGMKKENVYKK